MCVCERERERERERECESVSVSVCVGALAARWPADGGSDEHEAISAPG